VLASLGDLPLLAENQRRADTVPNNPVIPPLVTSASTNPQTSSIVTSVVPTTAPSHSPIRTTVPLFVRMPGSPPGSSSTPPTTMASGGMTFLNPYVPARYEGKTSIKDFFDSFDNFLVASNVTDDKSKLSSLSFFLVDPALEAHRQFLNKHPTASYAQAKADLANNFQSKTSPEELAKKLREC